ncbi:helix-turn-helix domain-containing protein [Jiella sonneratiae]|uniref:Helix-turn-helix transcriptional regulator n=1 Tax=Jiella sonneratiae TaxID=2816856 RepID=A0ABS3J4B6_9HYPH|nr:helix-turn-helix transcriptional regulator [Jiella sonneratiae]
MPAPIDVHVGARLREARIAAGLSMEELGLALSVSGDQLDRFERGAERIGASRLYLACQRLRVQPTYFFEGLGEFGPDGADGDVVATSHSNGHAAGIAVDRLIESIMQRIRTERARD